MSVVTASGLEGVLALAGRELGPTEWTEITQARVNLFADATDDHQWIHSDLERAVNESRYGGTIAHGYLTLSLMPFFLHQMLDITGFAMGVNYGCDKVRFPAPVPVGSRLRARALIDEVTPVSGGVQLRISVSVEVDSSTKPACVAALLIRRYGDERA